jgi:hypothetical protein
MQLIEPKAPLALRLAAVLMRGVVQLYSRQLFFLSGAPDCCVCFHARRVQCVIALRRRAADASLRPPRPSRPFAHRAFAEDATAVLLNLKSHIVAPGMDKHVLEERRQQARCAC